jgi:hypothetical protein
LVGGPPYVTGPSRTNTNVNIFREAELARNSAIPYVGAAGDRQQNAREIDAILQKYLTAP